MYLVENRITGKVYKMKSITKKGLAKWQINDIIENEQNVLKKIKCPFAEEFYYSFQTDKKIYMVTEYTNGGDFIQLLTAKGKLSEESVKLYSSEIIYVLEYLHKQNIICRDLSPLNIMLDEIGHVKFIDFLQAKLDDNLAVKTLCETPEYAEIGRAHV